MTANNSWIRPNFHMVGHIKYVWWEFNYLNPFYSHYAIFQIWSNKEINTDLFICIRSWSIDIMRQNDHIKANRLLISYLNLQKYIKNDSFLPESLKWSIKYVHIWKIFVNQVELVVKDLIFLQSNFKHKIEFTLQFHFFCKLDLTGLFELQSWCKFKRLIVGEKKLDKSAQLKFTVFNINFIWKIKDKILLIKARKLKIGVYRLN